MITLGEVFEKPKIELFLDCGDSKFYNSCRAREKEIKKSIKTTLKGFDVHVQVLAKNRNALAKWKKEWMTVCMTNLGEYLEYLINELDKKKIEDHCRLEEITGKELPFIADLVLLMINSYIGAIEVDLHWITDLTVHDSVEISVINYNSNQEENNKELQPTSAKVLRNFVNLYRHVHYYKFRNSLKALSNFIVAS